MPSAAQLARNAPGQMLDVGGHRLHLASSGSGRPTVVLEAALGGSSISWSLVQPAVASLTRVCAYDRAGFGWSDPGPMPRTAGRVADELYTLLDRGGVEPPFVLTIDPVEVADVFEVPLAFLLDPVNQQRHFRMQGERRRDFWAIPYGERYIWGATAAMLVILDRTLRALP